MMFDELKSILLDILAEEEYKAEIISMGAEEIVKYYGPNNKIKAIKAIREKHQLGLLEAKFIVDGFFRRNNWEK